MGSDRTEQDLATATGRWRAQSVRRVYQGPNLDQQLRAETRIMSRHGYRAVASTSLGDMYLVTYERTGRGSHGGRTTGSSASPSSPLDLGMSIDWGKVATVTVAAVIVAVFFFAGAWNPRPNEVGSGTRPPSQRLSPSECQRLGREWQQQNDRFDTLQAQVEARQADFDPARDLIDQQQRAVDRMDDLVDRMELGGCEV